MKQNIKLEIAVGAVMLISMSIGGPIWFADKYSQNGSQFVSSLAGKGKPDADAASKVVFLGDSITAREDWNVLFGVSYIWNSGVPGNTTDDIKDRVDAAISAKPKKLFLMMGINDLLTGRDVDYVLANYKTVLDKVRLQSPETTMYVQSVLPVNNNMYKSDNYDSRKIIALNQGIKSLSDGNKIFYIDLYPYFCGPDDQMFAKYAWDGLHPNSHGYAVWKNLISQYMN